MLAEVDSRTTIVVVSSKSGALEMRSLLCAVREAFLSVLDEEEFASRVVVCGVCAHDHDHLWK